MKPLSPELALLLYQRAYLKYREASTAENYAALGNARLDCVHWLSKHGLNETQVKAAMGKARADGLRSRQEVPQA